MENEVEYRIERDTLGEKKIACDVMYGINTVRALENFDLKGKTVNYHLIRGIVMVKKAGSSDL